MGDTNCIERNIYPTFPFKNVIEMFHNSMLVKRVNLPGGLPIIVGGHVVGGIGVGSGTGEEDRQVADAALGQLRHQSPIGPRNQWT